MLACPAKQGLNVGSIRRNRNRAWGYAHDTGALAVDRYGIGVLSPLATEIHRLHARTIAWSGCRANRESARMAAAGY
ncbi:MAG: hypothetical protein MNPFHGCM_01859 [Gemmatimonadaceae bacterium]|nr:hypothetical protein [Gemmatimonadaceae bacterium]